jgi:hypothetical protein
MAKTDTSYSPKTSKVRPVRLQVGEIEIQMAAPPPGTRSLRIKQECAPILSGLRHWYDKMNLPFQEGGHSCPFQPPCESKQHSRDKESPGMTTVLVVGGRGRFGHIHKMVLKAVMLLVLP